MPRKGYRNLSVPTEIMEAMEEIVAEKSLLYRTVSNLAIEALREKIITVRSQNKDWRMKMKRTRNEPRV